MSSTFTWLDYSDHDRRRAMEVGDLLRDEETRDELRLGVIRDAFADRLFPGTSTIQTRVRYFLFVPWAFQQLEHQRLDSSRFLESLRKTQDKLWRSLAEGGELLGVVLRESLAVYCMVLGQPRQEELLEYLRHTIPEDQLPAIAAALSICLEPAGGPAR